MCVWEKNAAIGKDRDLVAALHYQDWRTQNAVFEALGAYRSAELTLTGVGEPESITAHTVSSSLFRVLGVDALAGRTFTQEAQQSRARVVVLRHEFWQRRFGGDRSLVGKAITLTGAPFTVVGVMPPDFRFPEGAVFTVSGVTLVHATQEARVRRQRGRAALVVAEVALSLVLLAGAGLMLRSFVTLQNLDLGFTAENILTAQISLPGNRLPGWVGAVPARRPPTRHPNCRSRQPSIQS